MSSSSFKIPKQKLFSAYMAVGALCALLIAGSLWLESNNFSLRTEAVENYAGPIDSGIILQTTKTPSNKSSSSSGNATGSPTYAIPSGQAPTQAESGSAGSSAPAGTAAGSNNANTSSKGTDAIGRGGDPSMPQDSGGVSNNSGDNWFQSLIRRTIISSIGNAIIRAIIGYDALSPQVAQNASQYAASGYANRSPSISDKIASWLGLDANQGQEYDSYGNIITRDANGNVISSEQASSSSPFGIASDGQDGSNGQTGVTNSRTNGATGFLSTIVSALFGGSSNANISSNDQAYALGNNQAYTQPHDLNPMCFLGPALLDSVPEWLQKIPYVGNTLNDIFIRYVAYKTYSRCGDTYGSYQYNTATGQPQFYYNPPLTTQFTQTNQGLGIIVKGPYENFQQNLIDLTGRIPVLGSPLAASILLNN